MLLTPREVGFPICGYGDSDDQKYPDAKVSGALEARLPANRKLPEVQSCTLHLSPAGCLPSASQASTLFALTLQRIPSEMAVRYKRYRASQLLRLGSGLPQAEFREGQEEAIRHVVEGRGRLLVVQRTGWGKSFVYFIAIKMLREEGLGPALLVSPLLALMRNQIAAAKRMGVRAETINSDNREKWTKIETIVRADNLDILLISPERLANERFVEQVLATVGNRVSLLVIDEAHCISDWGHDFRPDYRRIERVALDLPSNMRMLGTTATANNRVVNDLKNVLGPNLYISRGDLHRTSLTLQTIRMRNQAERLAWLAERVPEFSGSGIVYTLTVRDAIRVAKWLQSRGLAVEAYTGQTGDLRPKLEEDLLDNKLKALVATSALGMGFDKPDLSFVVHFQTPGSVITYYQQVGRAGRALDSAYGVLLSGNEDTKITDYFINSAFPTPNEVEQVIEALKREPDGLSVPELLKRENISEKRVEHTLNLLSIESPAPVVKEGMKWQLTPGTLGAGFWQRAERLTELRKKEQAEMQDYVDLQSGHMQFLIRALDGNPDESAAHGKMPPLPTKPDPEMVRNAVAFLKRTSLEINPRQKGPSKTIPADLRFQPGRALSAYDDSGWGQTVAQGKFEADHFSNELVTVCVSLFGRWNPHPSPQWVTCIPSLRRPNLVPDFAERLAAKLCLPFRPLLVRTKERPEQKTMENSAQQVRNVWGSIEVKEKPPVSPVLLVDDIVDSRWTLAVAAYLLRSHGSGEVWPLALAQA